jgi:hypothetical protein
LKARLILTGLHESRIWPLASGDSFRVVAVSKDVSVLRGRFAGRVKKPVTIAQMNAAIAQAALATRLIEHTLTASKPGFVSLVVLVELHWVMCSLYSVTRVEWLDALDDLLASQNINLEQRDVVQAAGCQHTVSFERVTVRNAGLVAL